MNRVGDNLVHWGANERIVDAIVKHHVEFLIIGGLAVAWYCENREAKDMDVLVNPTTENSEKVVAALNTINISTPDKHAYAKLGVMSRINSIYLADILTPKNTSPTFDELVANSVEAKLFQLPILIPSKADLIQLKENTILDLEENVVKHKNDLKVLNASTL